MSDEILGVGNDIIEIERIRKSIEAHGDQFLSRLFTIREQEYCRKYQDPTPRFAGRFAAKEAIAKAFGSGFGKQASWLDIEIVNNSEGKPEVFLSPALKKLFNDPQILVSISHCKDYATAIAVLKKAER